MQAAAMGTTGRAVDLALLLVVLRGWEGSVLGGGDF